MSETTESIETKVETVNIDIDELFNGAPSAEGITLPQEENTKPNIFSNKNNSADMSFTEPEESSEEVEDKSQEEVSDQKDNQETKEIFEEINENTDDSYDEDAQYSSNKKLTGISNVFNKLIEKDKIIPFDDGKDLNDYCAIVWVVFFDGFLLVVFY